MSPASIFETKFAQAKASISQRAIVRRVGRTRLSPSSMPPYPAHKPMCVSSLVVSTLFRLHCCHERISHFRGGMHMYMLV